MSTNDTQTSNVEKFNAIMRRTSDRLRGGSVPPLESEQTVHPPLDPDQPPSSITTESQRGRGRGRGRRNARGSTRPATQATTGDRAPIVTLTVPRIGGNSTPDATPASSSALDTEGNSLSADTPVGGNPSGQTPLRLRLSTCQLRSLNPPTSGDAASAMNLPSTIRCVMPPCVMPPWSMIISKDLGLKMFFLSGSHSLLRLAAGSPSRRNTIDGVGISPPKGFHSWLSAMGLAVVKQSDTTGTSVQNVTAALRNVPRNPSNSVPRVQPGVPALPQRPVVKPANPVVREVICLDGTGGTSNAPEKSPSDVGSTKATSNIKPEVSDEGIENTGLVALSKHWDDKIRPLEGYLPLSIFNINWLKMDLLKHSQRPKTYKDKDGEKYHGLSVPSEWKMTFGEWVTAFDLCVTYLYYYKHDRLADRFKIHKENVFAIMRDRLSWPMAFRYNLAIRTTVLTFRNADGKVANPALVNETFERNARLDSERLGDFDPRFTDINPYADGQCKANINPLTGELLRPGANPFQANTSNQFGYGSTKPNARSWTYANQAHYKGPGSVGYFNGGDDRASGNRVTRGRGRGGGYNSNGNREEGLRGRRGGHDGYDSRRAEGSGAWRRDDRRDKRKGDEREPHGPRFGGNGKAKRTNGCCAGVCSPPLPGRVLSAIQEICNFYLELSDRDQCRAV
ncbi:uncharacterized protein MELLADRAFT_85342 [Melampsora larici-populina 98AG31]|uniref:Uncharacterized protein n=1 Tax=Melampsora larici-populina (strain 98AG31 / pathotype 3-4-7) TaxID=747676 RepID=F4SD22_MELLP|nr:uncharacterized protein MELLADRAFT_85342 [Melampsora larici-populina 98AG31]EGF97455.1 hypothetical protein MELLADRAFT_85342 [Melampsora larici-populina 98AG31]